MAVACKVGNLNITTGAAGATVAVTSLGFQPKVLILWWTGLTSTSAGTRQSSLRGHGFAVSASSFMANANFDTDNVGTSVSKNGGSTSYCVIELDNTGAIVGGADLQSFDADGFTLEIQDQFVTDLLVSYMAIGGADITNAEIGTFTPAGVAPTNQTVNNAGNFQPDITFFLLGVNATGAADSRVTLGVATGAATAYVHNCAQNDNSAAGDSASYNLSGECIAYGASPDITTNRAEFVSHNAPASGGFTINWLERANAVVVGYLSIKGGLWAVGDLLTQTDTVTAIAESGLGFTPVGVMVVSAGKAASTADTPTAHDKWSVGAADSASSRVVQQVDARSANTAMFVHPSARTDAVYVNTDPAQTAHTLTGLADVQSFDADGFTLIMDDADPAQAFAWYVAVGNVASGGMLKQHPGMGGGFRDMTGGLVA